MWTNNLPPSTPLIRSCAFRPETFYGYVNIVNFEIFATIVNIEMSLLNVITVYKYKTVTVAKNVFLCRAHCIIGKLWYM
jgi:hypothetical protein